jgi:outer membrane protein TolC
MVLSGLTLPRFVSRTVFALLLLVLSAALRGETFDVAGTMPEDHLPALKEILAIALRQSPDIIAREFERQTQEARLYEANSGRLPQLGGSFRYGSTATATSSNTSSQTRDNGFFYDFGLSQAVFHWGALKNRSDAARINNLIATKSFALAYRDLSVVLRQSYLALIVEKARVRHAREGLRVLRMDLETTKLKQQQGTVPAATVEGDRLREAEVALEVARAEEEFAANRRRFARVAGIPVPDEAAIPDELPRPAYHADLAAAMTAALLRDGAKGTLEYEIYDGRVREALLRYKIERVRLYPKISANAGYSLENNTNVNGNAVEQRAVTRQTLSVGGSWNIFDGFATRGAIKEALIARRASEQRRATETDKILQTAQTLERMLKLDAEHLGYAETRRDLMVETKRRIAEEAGFGTLPKNEVERASVGVALGEVTNAAARATFFGRWAELVSIAGHDPVLNNLPARHVREIK